MTSLEGSAALRVADRIPVGVLQRPLSLVSFISRLPAGNGSLRAAAKMGVAPALRGRVGLSMILKKPVPNLVWCGTDSGFP